MNQIEKMPPDTWLEQLKEWKKEAESTLRLLKKEYNRKFKTEQPAHITITGSISHGSPQFFHRETKSGKLVKIYYHQKELEQVQQQLQKEYLQELIKKMEANIKSINAFVKNYEENRAWSYFETLSRAKQMTIAPALLPDQMFIEKWQSEPYIHKGFIPGTAEHYTGKNERVRSKSEVIIADTLAQSNIPYKYEMPVYIGGLCVHPDFCCLNVRTRQEIFWEHLGMLDDPNYVAKNFMRLQAFQAHGYCLGRKLIITWETAETPFNKEDAQRIIEDYLV